MKSSEGFVRGYGVVEVFLDVVFNDVDMRMERI